MSQNTVIAKDSAGRRITLDMDSATLTISGKKFHHTAVLTGAAVATLAAGFATLASSLPFGHDAEGTETTPEIAAVEVL